MLNPRDLGLTLGGVWLGLVLCGCIQIDTHVKLNQDGSATITEKIRFSRRLLDLSGKEGTAEDLAGRLKKEAALERAKHMGKGTVLVSHEIKDVEEGAREAQAVYKIDDLNELHYCSPFAAFQDYAQNNTAKFHVYPMLASSWMGYQAGEIAVALRPVQPPKLQEKPKEGEPPRPGSSPLDVQIYRDLQPMFREMLKDFKLKLTFETYTSIRFCQFGMRGAGAASSSVDLIHFTGQDLDKYGAPFLENEELLLNLLRGELFSQNIADHIKDWPRNLTLPVFHNWGSPYPISYHDGIFFKPSQHFFTKFFEGKMLDEKRPAKFDEIGVRSSP